MGIQIIKITATAADVSGDSSDTTTHPVNGIIRAVEVVYGASSSSGMDLYLTEEGKSVDQAILTVTGSATSAWYYPHNFAQDNTGADMYYNDDGDEEIPVPFYVARPLTLVQDDQTAAKTVTVYIYVEK